MESGLCRCGCGTGRAPYGPILACLSASDRENVTSKRICCRLEDSLLLSTWNSQTMVQEVGLQNAIDHGLSSPHLYSGHEISRSSILSGTPSGPPPVMPLQSHSSLESRQSLRLRQSSTKIPSLDLPATVQALRSVVSSSQDPSVFLVSSRLQVRPLIYRFTTQGRSREANALHASA